MAGQVSAVGELRRAIRTFLDSSGADPHFKAVVGDLRGLDQKLGSVGQPSGQPSPGQKAAGVTDVRGPGDGSDNSPGGRAAAASTTSSGSPGLPGANSAKGQSNLPPFMRRELMKRKATARGGS